MSECRGAPAHWHCFPYSKVFEVVHILVCAQVFHEILKYSDTLRSIVLCKKEAKRPMFSPPCPNSPEIRKWREEEHNKQRNKRPRRMGLAWDKRTSTAGDLARRGSLCSRMSTKEKKDAQQGNRREKMWKKDTERRHLQVLERSLAGLGKLTTWIGQDNWYSWTTRKDMEKSWVLWSSTELRSKRCVVCCSGPWQSKSKTMPSRLLTARAYESYSLACVVFRARGELYSCR